MHINIGLHIQVTRKVFADEMTFEHDLTEEELIRQKEKLKGFQVQGYHNKIYRINKEESD